MWWLLVLVLIVVVIGIVAVVMERRRSTVGPDAREDRIKNPRRGPVMAGYVPLNRSSTVRRRRKLLKWCGRTRLRGLMATGCLVASRDRHINFEPHRLPRTGNRGQCAPSSCDYVHDQQPSTCLLVAPDACGRLRISLACVANLHTHGGGARPRAQPYRPFAVQNCVRDYLAGRENHVIQLFRGQCRQQGLQPLAGDTH